MKILVGYDHSSVSEELINLARKHAQAFGAEVCLMTSLEQGSTLKGTDVQRAESRLERMMAHFKADGIPCETNVSVSYLGAGEDLVKYAREHSVDEIIIGVKRKSKVGKLMFGSNAQYIILKAPCPVVSVR
jgi:nucleotide-binding universal stress UspA family protein